MSGSARKIAIPAMFALCIGALTSITHAGIIQVYLQGGQSNADGRASTSGLPTSPVNLQQPQADVAFFFHTEGSAHALDRTLTTLRPGQSETNGFGPEITFGRDMADYFSGTPSVSVAIIKYGNGGTNLHTQWKAGGDATTTGDGSEYVIFQDTVTAGLAAIAAANPGNTVMIAGMIWMQGESDNNTAANASAYQANLTSFIADVRATYGANLPFVIGEIAVNGGNSNTATIRAAQAAVAAADSFTGFVDVDTFGMQDNLHFSPAGQMSLGSGFSSVLQTPFVPDASPPTPDPMTFSVAPSAVNQSSVTMTATTAADVSGVEYFFENTAGGGNGGSDSGWQDGAVYVDIGLLAGAEYSYRVRARDKSAAQNVTGFSSSIAATTASAGAATTIISNGDTYIRSSSATTNFNVSPHYMVTNLKGTDVRMAVFSFDISSVPPGTIASAKLQLEDVIGNATQDYQVYGLLDADEGFDESSLTWNTATFLSGSTIDTTKVYGGAALGTFSNVQNTVNTVFDVTNGNFIDFLNASSDNDITFVIVDNNSSDPGTGWATKENGTALKPTLTLAGSATGYVNWTANYPGLDLTDSSADYDLDGLSNIIEAWFGTNPDLWDLGPGVVSSEGKITVFSHPKNTSEPSDVIGSYQWSPNLEDWYGSGDGPVGGVTAMITPITVGNTTSVTLTMSEDIPGAFFRVMVTPLP
jgi:hypothetical protein